MSAGPGDSGGPIAAEGAAADSHVLGGVASALLAVDRLQKWLGHAKPSITLNPYTHLWPDEEDTTRAATDAVFSNAPSMCPPRPKS